MHSFIAVLVGMICLFPGSLIVYAQISVGSAAIVVALMLVINAVFWLALLRPRRTDA